MLDSEGQWSAALASNNVRGIIRWLRTLQGEESEILQTFSCWAQRTSEFARKELLTLCFSRCRGRWMFLDRISFARVHVLLQRLRNLLTLAEWAKQHLVSAHLWHGAGLPCEVCRDTHASSGPRRGCWARERAALMQHVWLGRLVQWFSIMGLLPKSPEADEVKQISQMWREIEHGHHKAHPETLGRDETEKEGELRSCSLICGLVTEMRERYGGACTWDEGRGQCYPPPDLQALLKLVAVSSIYNLSVQAVLMYFILDMTNFLQCKNDLLRSFCQAFTVPASFSQQVRAFWLLDHGHVKASMELVLSPRAAVPLQPWQHRCILRCLLMRKQPRLALKYLLWTRPAMENGGDVKLCADVLLQNSCVSEAWSLLRRGHTEREDITVYFLQRCNTFGLCTKSVNCLPAGCNMSPHLTHCTFESDSSAAGQPCPLSAKLYRAQRVSTVSPEELVELVEQAAMELRRPRPKISKVVWPKRMQQEPDVAPGSAPIYGMDEGAALLEEHEDEDQQQQQQHEKQNRSSSCEDLDSVSSFASTSSPRPPPHLPRLFQSTVTLQRISSLLTDGENQSAGDEDEEEEEEAVEKEEIIAPPTSVDILPDRSWLLLTAGGAADLVSNSGSNVGGAAQRCELSAEGVTELCALPRDDPSDCIAPPLIFQGAESEEEPHQEARWLRQRDETRGDVPHSLIRTSGTCGGPVKMAARESRLPAPAFCCAPPETTDEGPSEARSEEDGASGASHHCRVGRGVEAHRTSCGLLGAAEPAKEKKSVVSHQACSNSLLSLADFTAQQRGDNRGGNQLHKEEPGAAGWSLGKAPQGAIRSGRTRPRGGKRGKRT